MRHFRKPSPAFIVASIALVLALRPVAEAANTVFSTDIVDGEVKNADIGNNQVTSVKIYPRSVTNSDLAALAVTSDKIAANAIGPALVADNSLTTLELKGADVQTAISLPAGFVEYGKCKDSNVAVSGANVGDIVLFTPKASVPVGVVIDGLLVPSAGTATLRVCNITGGAFPAINNLPVRITTLS